MGCVSVEEEQGDDDVDDDAYPRAGPLGGARDDL